MVMNQGSGGGDQGKRTKQQEKKKNSSSQIPNPHSPIPEVGGRGGKDPTRFGDWEINGKCVDF